MATIKNAGKYNFLRMQNTLLTPNQFQHQEDRNALRFSSLRTKTVFGVDGGIGSCGLVDYANQTKHRAALGRGTLINVSLTGEGYRI